MGVGGRYEAAASRVCELVVRQAQELIEGVALHHGTPGPSEGHLSKEQSYFDRFWELRGDGERYFMVLNREG